jgi:hypothetical protein
MRELTEALALDARDRAGRGGYSPHRQTWLIGTRKPAERNRSGWQPGQRRPLRAPPPLEGRRWSQRRDAALCAAKLALMSADQRVIWERDGERLRARSPPPPSPPGSASRGVGQLPAHTPLHSANAVEPLAASGGTSGSQPAARAGRLATTFTTAAAYLYTDVA